MVSVDLPWPYRMRYWHRILKVMRNTVTDGRRLLMRSDTGKPKLNIALTAGLAFKEQGKAFLAFMAKVQEDDAPAPQDVRYLLKV